MSNEFVEKDNKTFYIIVIVILSLIVCALGGYIIYDKFLAMEVEEVETPDVGDESNDDELSASLAEEYIDKISIYNNYFYKYYLSKENSSISDKERLTFAYGILSYEEKEITAENVSNVLEKYFGKEHNVKLDDIYCDVMDRVIYEYDSENNIYIEKGHIGHGGNSRLISDVEYVSSKVEGNKVSVDTHVIYLQLCGDICEPASGVFGSYNDMMNKTNMLYANKNNEFLFFTDKDYNSIKDKFPITTYNFVVEENGNYYLESVSLSK